MSKSTALCHHLHPDAHRCGSPALRGDKFCYHHHPSRPAARRSAEKTAFRLPVLVDRRAVQFALSEVAIRIADNTLDIRRASLLLQCLQTAAASHTI